MASLPFTLKQSASKRVKERFFQFSQSTKTILHSKYLHLPIQKIGIQKAEFCLTEENFQYIEEWSLIEFRCSKKLCPLIMNHISHITFSNLTFLHLSTCYIESIEAISWLNAPNISQISLDDNDIRSIKPLEKTNFEKLDFLSCYNNFFGHDQIKTLNRMKLNSNTVSHVKLNRSGSKRTHFLEGLFKLEVGQKINASISYTEFNNIKIFEKISQKFPSSLTSMAEEEVWMPQQQTYLKEYEQSQSSEDEESSYFPYLNI